MKSLHSLTQSSNAEKAKQQEKEFLARNGDLRRPPMLHHGGTQFFDSADWSMFKDDIRKELKIVSLPHKTSTNQRRVSSSRKSIFASDSARALTSKSRTKTNTPTTEPVH